MVKSKLGLFCGVFLCLFAACQTREFDTEEELLTYIRDAENGFLQQKSVNNVEFSLLYKPTDLMVKQELIQKSTQGVIDSLREKYGRYMYFVLSMSRNKQELLSHAAGNRSRFGAMVNELSFHIDRKVHCYTPEKDTLPMADFIYPRMYGMSRSTDILLVYPRDKKYLAGEYLDITVEDLGFYTGEVKFRMLTNTIISDPKLKYKL
ncbi:hypothetical protein [Sinomicrobium sp. M5D2P9]